MGGVTEVLIGDRIGELKAAMALSISRESAAREELALQLSIQTSLNTQIAELQATASKLDIVLEAGVNG